MKQQLFEDDWILKFFKYLKNRKLMLEYLPKKRKIIFSTQEQDKLLSIRLSIQMEFELGASELKSSDFKNFVLILIRSGLASVALVENEEIVDHKVFRSYMVRKKQGKSQIKYLKTKGKSRAGSRVRLAETLEFFEDINQRVNTYFDGYRIDLIGISCSQTLLPYFFGSSTSSAFDKKDHRLFRIPKHIASPTYESQKNVKNLLHLNEVKVEESGLAFFQDFIEQESKTKSDDFQNDDW